MKLMRAIIEQRGFLFFAWEILWRPVGAWIFVAGIVHSFMDQPWNDCIMLGDTVAVGVLLFQLYYLNTQSAEWRRNNIRDVQEWLEKINAATANLERTRAEILEARHQLSLKVGDVESKPH